MAKIVRSTPKQPLLRKSELTVGAIYQTEDYTLWLAVHAGGTLRTVHLGTGHAVSLPDDTSFTLVPDAEVRV